MNPYQSPRENPPPAPAMEACADVMVELGATPREAKPWLYRMLWRMGFEARPPLYAGLAQGFFVQGLPFAMLWTVFMCLTAWRGKAVPNYALALGIMVMGLVMTLTSHWAMGRTRKRRSLPDWNEIVTLAATRIRH